MLLNLLSEPREEVLSETSSSMGRSESSEELELIEYSLEPVGSPCRCFLETVSIMLTIASRSLSRPIRCVGRVKEQDMSFVAITNDLSPSVSPSERSSRSLIRSCLRPVVER